MIAALGHSLRHGLQRTAGELIFGCAPAWRNRLLRHWTKGGTALPPFRRWLFAGVSLAIDRRYYAPAASTAERERLKTLCMGRESAIGWARQYLARGFPEAQTAALPMFAEIERTLASGAVRTVHQVACCSGREIAWFAQRHPQIHFTGSDCDPALIAFLRDHWRALPNLAFEFLRLEDSATDAERPSCDLCYASGGFHYLDPAALRGFAERCRRWSRRLFLSQPLDRNFAAEAAPASTPRGQLSWNHPYPAVLRGAGWSEVRQAEGFLPELPRFKNIAVFARTEL